MEWMELGMPLLGDVSTQGDLPGNDPLEGRKDIDSNRPKPSKIHWLVGGLPIKVLYTPMWYQTCGKANAICGACGDLWHVMLLCAS